jgi:hypothetical protein
MDKDSGWVYTESFTRTTLIICDIVGTTEVSIEQFRGGTVVKHMRHGYDEGEIQARGGN